MTDIFSELDKLLQTQTITLELLHPASNKGIGIRLELDSYESDAVKSAIKAWEARRRRTGKKSEVTAEEKLDLYRHMQAAAIVSWDWHGVKGQKTPEATLQNKLGLLSRPGIAKQVDEALGDEAAFFVNSETA